MRSPGSYVLAAALLLAGCNDNQLGLEKRRPNRPPVTTLASGPPDSTYGTNYKVHFFWSGGDPDGTIDHYDFILVDHPASNDSIAASSPDYLRRVAIEIPEVDDPRWASTFVKDTLLVTRADTLRRNPSPPNGLPETQLGSHNDFVRRQSFERWHTFFVRAVDNEGLPDFTPEYRSFNSRTLAPTVTLLPPVVPNLPFLGPKVIVFNWDGTDPVGDGTLQAPIASRWALLRSSRDQSGNYGGWPRGLYALPENAWSRWRPWDASDLSGRRAIVRNLEHAGSDPRNPNGVGFYLFAVQAMDEAGAVTPVFDDTTPGSNNATKILVTNRAGPTVTLRDRLLGTFTFSGRWPPVRLDVAAGQDLKFTWDADAAEYGGEIVGYRYGWDIRNPLDDSEWEQNWSATARRAQARVFNSGTHRFLLEARDNAESITTASLEIEVHQTTRRLDLLYVDDSHHPQGENDPAENLETTRWMFVLDELRRRQPFEFRPDRDIFRANTARLPPLPLLFDYKTVIWNHIGSDANSALRVLASFFDPFLESNRSRVQPFNYVNIYLENGGQMWLSGQQTTALLWPITRRNLRDQPQPVNVTNWDDPQESHPLEDSVGVNSFLYKMGIEAFVLGAGSGAPFPRSRTEHGCRGFRRGVPGNFQAQGFNSSLEFDHQHPLTIPTADVDDASDRIYTTQQQVDHRHVVEVTAAQFGDLQRGRRIVVSSRESALPETHAHRFELVDQVGLWGGPPVLQVQESQWALPVSSTENPLRLRPNVEILNMPVFMGKETPPLSPEPGISVALYSYVSGVPANRSTNPQLVYPETADEQPVFILRRPFAGAPRYTRAYCGFEPWRLMQDSHVALADFVLLRHFRLGSID